METRELNVQEMEVLNNLWLDVLGGIITEDKYVEEKDKIMTMIANDEDIFI